MPQGIIAGLSRNKRRAAAQTDAGYTVFDLVDGELSIGDVISGNLDDHGSQDLTNQTTRQKLSAYIEATGATQKSAQSLLSSK
ncbi:MAG: hypothetical protein Q8K57_13300 [Thiobacillus sp.]|nr:hypothetical protein [Thiobacillus sp.]